MTHRLAGILSDYLSREQMIEKDEADIYEYGLEIFMDGVLETLLLVVLGILVGQILAKHFVLLCHLQCLEVSQEDTMQPQR